MNERYGLFSKIIEKYSSGHAKLKPSKGGENQLIKSEIEKTIPSDVLDFFSMFDGQEDVSGIIMGFWINSVGMVLQETKRLRAEISDGYYVGLSGRSIGPVRNNWFNKDWIPIFGSDNQNISIDLDPDDQGIVGQLILVDYEDDVRVVLASCLSEFISIISNSIESGKLVYDADSGGFYPNDSKVELSEILGISIIDSSNGSENEREESYLVVSDDVDVDGEVKVDIDQCNDLLNYASKDLDFEMPIVLKNNGVDKPYVVIDFLKRRAIGLTFYTLDSSEEYIHNKIAKEYSGIFKCRDFAVLDVSRNILYWLKNNKKFARQRYILGSEKYD